MWVTRKEKEKLNLFRLSYSHRKKREQKAKQNQKLGKPHDDEFDLFINSAEIRYT
jgi:hypothetical protein